MLFARFVGRFEGADGCNPAELVAAPIEVEPWLEWRVHDLFVGGAGSVICDFVGGGEGEGQQEEEGKKEELVILAHCYFVFQPSHFPIFQELA